MLRKIKCLLKGHLFVMNYREEYRCYYYSKNDKCKHCHARRQHEP